MTRTHAGLAGGNWRSLYWGIVCGAALLTGCAAPATRESAPTPAPEPSAQATAPAAPDTAKAPPKGAATGEISEADLAGKEGTMSPADQEALAELIRVQVMAARAQQGSTESEAKAPAPKPQETSAATAAREQEPRAGAISSLSNRAPGAAPDEPAADSGARMQLSPTEFDFKEVWQGQPAEGEFVIKNVGTAPLTLDTRSSCGCTVATKPKSPLEPGQETKFKISYNTSHAGKAQKTVTVTTNDPEHPSAVIRVNGSVKALVAATPSDRVAFSNLETDSVESRTIQLESQYNAPLNLKLRENPNPGPFTVELKELEPGKRYELTVTTKPPLALNLNNTTVILETGLNTAPTVPVYLTASVPPRVAVIPARLSVAASAKQPAQQTLQVNYRASTPVEITDVKSDNDAVKWEMLPAGPVAADAKMRTYRLRVTLPTYDELPDTGATLQIFTSAPDEPYKQLDVPIVKLRAPAARATPATPAAPATPPAKS